MAPVLVGYVWVRTPPTRPTASVMAAGAPDDVGVAEIDEQLSPAVGDANAVSGGAGADNLDRDAAGGRVVHANAHVAHVVGHRLRGSDGRCEHDGDARRGARRAQGRHPSPEESSAQQRFRPTHLGSLALLPAFPQEGVAGRTVDCAIGSGPICGYRPPPGTNAGDSPGGEAQGPPAAGRLAAPALVLPNRVLARFSLAFSGSGYTGAARRRPPGRRARRARRQARIDAKEKQSSPGRGPRPASRPRGAAGSRASPAGSRAAPDPRG